MADSVLSYAERTFGLPAGSFPFRSRFLGIQGTRLHYIDEGTGPTLVMLHGNPTWGFLYRHLIHALRDRYRCIAIDLAGFGLSVPAPGFSFLPGEQAALLAEAFALLHVQKATLVAHDWGGPIGLDAMRQRPGSVARLCLGSTWAWPVNGDPHFEWFSRIMGGAFGRWATRHFAIFVNLILPRSMRRKRLTANEMAAYRAPFPTPDSRTPMHVLPAQIIAARDWLLRVEETARGFAGPVQIIWPRNDIAFRTGELARWQAIFPRAGVTRIPHCGHFLWDDAPEDCIAALQSFLQRS